MRRLLLVPVLLLTGCGDDDASPTTTEGGCRSAVEGRVEVVARDLAWDTACLAVPAGEPVTLVVDNRDDGVNHNLHLPEAPDAPATVLALGPVVQELAVTLPAGEHRYVCDIHPTMVGVVNSEEQVTPPG